MRTFLLVALAAAAFAAPAGAGHSEGTGPKNDLAAGSGKFVSTTGPGGVATAMAFSVSAHATKSGVHGNVNYRGVAFTGEEQNGKARVACFGVQGNRAAILAEFVGASPFGDAFPYALLFLEDNGQPSGDVPDRAIATATGAGAQGGLPSCPLSQSVLAALAELALPVESGNVVVHDALP